MDREPAGSVGRKRGRRLRLRLFSATNVPPQRTDNNNLETLSRAGTEEFTASSSPQPPPLCTCSSDPLAGRCKRNRKKGSFYFAGGWAAHTQEERGACNPGVSLLGKPRSNLSLRITSPLSLLRTRNLGRLRDDALSLSLPLGVGSHIFAASSFLPPPPPIHPSSLTLKASAPCRPRTRADGRSGDGDVKDEKSFHPQPSPNLMLSATGKNKTFGFKRRATVSFRPAEGARNNQGKERGEGKKKKENAMAEVGGEKTSPAV